MGTLGGALKRKEQISGRFADILSWMYLITAALRRFDVEGGRSEAEHLMRWSVEYGFHKIQEAFEALFQNLPVPVIGPLVRGPIAAWSRLNRVGRYPADLLTAQVAEEIQDPGGIRGPLTHDIHVPDDPEQALGRLERAMLLAHEAEQILRKIRDAIRSGELPVGKPEVRRRDAVDAGVITEEQDRLLDAADAARLDYIQVDSFAVEEFVRQASDPELTSVDSNGERFKES
jgi:acyl-CoA dehydrogenase